MKPQIVESSQTDYFMELREAVGRPILAPLSEVVPLWPRLGSVARSAIIRSLEKEME